jgi:hypothetical protein
VLKITNAKKSDEVAQVVKQLPSKSKAVGSIPVLSKERMRDKREMKERKRERKERKRERKERKKNDSKKE